MSSLFWRRVRFFFSSKRKKRHSNSSKKLLNLLGFTPKNELLFREALTPRSARMESAEGDSFNYERLEFLGDAILGAIVAEYLYENAPHEKEGYLTEMRSKIVSRKQLNLIGNKIDLISLIDDKIKENITLSNNISGDMFESLIGAIYEDQGFIKTKDFIHRVIIEPYVDLNNLEKMVSSYKSLVLEWCQKNKKSFLLKTEKEENANNIVSFASKLFIDNKEVAKGRGSSKKKAEECAAKRAFFIYKKKISQ